MAAKVRTLDVWIVESNTVYRDVPFTVVSDWIQQGRLLADDRARATAKGEWIPLGELPDFAPYFPKVESFRAEDRAEALEPVQMEFAWKPRRPDEDEDVDMVPLIDVSLVLLIFFMMTASAAISQSPIKTPSAEFGTKVTNDPTMLWLGIDGGADGALVYSLGQGQKGAAPDEQGLSFEGVIQALAKRINEEGRPVEVRIRANENLPGGKIDPIIIELEKLRARGDERTGIANYFTEVSERKQP